MQRLEVSCAVRLLYTSLGAEGLKLYFFEKGRMLKKESGFEWPVTIRSNFKIISRCVSYYKERNKQMTIEHNFIQYQYSCIGIIKSCVRLTFVCFFLSLLYTVN
jgi:hypothetical protein